MALSDTQIRTAKPADKPYKLTDGEGMHLLVHPNAFTYWRLSYRFNGKQKNLALGVYPATTLAAVWAKRAEGEHLDERRLMRQWWADFLDANTKKSVDPFEFAHQSLMTSTKPIHRSTNLPARNNTRT